MAGIIGRVTPRISVNKLGEYMVATPARRRRILLDQKRPKEFIVTRYRDAVAAMADFLIGGAQDDAVIYRAIEELDAKETNTDFQTQDRDLSIEALENFIETVDRFDLEGLEVIRGAQDALPLFVAGVSISVRPELIVTRSSDRGYATAGCLKLYVSKRSPLDQGGVAAGYIGAALFQHVETSLSDAGRADYRLCQIIDVFGQQVFTAPRAMQRRLNDLQAACEEIAILWNAV